MKKIDVLLFDLDGTLVDSNQLIIESFRQTFQIHFPKSVPTETEIISLVGPPLFETFQLFTKSNDQIQEMIETYRTIYQQLEFSYIDIYPNVTSTLSALKAMGCHLGVVTSKFKVSAKPSLEHFGIASMMDVVVGLDDVKNHKPHPEPVWKALESFTYQEAMMIGDNPSDLLAGKHAGILTCGVEWTLKKVELKQLNPDFWIHDFRDLIDIIQKNHEEAI